MSSFVQEDSSKVNGVFQFGGARERVDETRAAELLATVVNYFVS